MVRWKEGERQDVEKIYRHPVISQFTYVWCPILPCSAANQPAPPHLPGGSRNQQTRCCHALRVRGRGGEGRRGWKGEERRRGKEERRGGGEDK